MVLAHNYEIMNFGEAQSKTGNISVTKGLHLVSPKSPFHLDSQPDKVGWFGRFLLTVGRKNNLQKRLILFYGE